MSRQIFDPVDMYDTIINWRNAADRNQALWDESVHIGYVATDADDAARALHAAEYRWTSMLADYSESSAIPSDDAMSELAADYGTWAGYQEAVDCGEPYVRS